MTREQWRQEAREAQARRAACTTGGDRFALDNEQSKSTGLPLGLLVLAIELEDREAGRAPAEALTEDEHDRRVRLLDLEHWDP